MVLPHLQHQRGQALLLSQKTKALNVDVVVSQGQTGILKGVKLFCSATKTSLKCRCGFVPGPNCNTKGIRLFASLTIQTPVNVDVVLSPRAERQHERGPTWGQTFGIPNHTKADESRLSRGQTVARRAKLAAYQTIQKHMGNFLNQGLFWDKHRCGFVPGKTTATRKGSNFSESQTIQTPINVLWFCLWAELQRQCLLHMIPRRRPRIYSQSWT